MFHHLFLDNNSLSGMFKFDPVKLRDGSGEKSGEETAERGEREPETS